MNRWIYKISIYVFLFCMGIFHLSEYEQVWNIVMYYIASYGLIYMFILHIINRTSLDKYDRIESRIFILFYLLPKMAYHILNRKCTYLDYLYNLDSEFWSGIYTFLVLFLMICFQLIYLIKYAKNKRR